MNFSLIFTLTILQLSLFILFFKRRFPKDFYLRLGILVFIFFHFIPTFLFNNMENDVLLMRDVVKIFLSNKDIYQPSSFPDYFHSYPRFTPYFPFWIYFVGFADFLASRLAIPYALVFKIPAVFANLGIALLLLKLTRQKRLFVLYLLNPVPTLISSYQGHWDAVVLFFLLLGIYFFLKGKKTAGLIISLATLIKPWPIIFIPLLLLRIKGKKRFLFIILFLLPLLLSISIYSSFVSTSFVRIIKSIFFYQSMTGWWGISLILFIIGKRLFPLLNPQIFLDMEKWLLGGVVIFVSYLRKMNLIQHIIFMTLLVYVLTPGFSIHYLVWIVPFALLTNDLKNYFFYTIFASIFLLLVFSYIVFPSHAPFVISEYTKGILTNLLSLIVWGYCVNWLFQCVRLSKLFKYFSKTAKI